MFVKDLMEELKTCNPDAIIMCFDLKQYDRINIVNVDDLDEYVDINIREVDVMYGVYERVNKKDKIIEIFKNKADADEHRIYLQPDYANILIVRPIPKQKEG